MRRSSAAQAAALLAAQKGHAGRWSRVGTGELVRKLLTVLNLTSPFEHTDVAS